MVFIVLDDLGTCSPARSVQGALSSPGRAGKGVGPSLTCPALLAPGGCSCGMESTGIFQEGPRSISLSCAQLGPSAAGAASMRAPALLTSGSFPLSSFSFSSLPHRDRAGAARAAFVKHFKALGVRGHTRLCQDPLRARDPWISHWPCPPVHHPPLFCIIRTFNEPSCFLKRN